MLFVGGTLGDRAGFAVAGGVRIDPGPEDDLLIGAPGVDLVTGARAGGSQRVSTDEYGTVYGIVAGAIALVYAARSGHLDRARAALKDEESWRRLTEHVNSFALLALEFRLLVVIPFLRFFVMICAFMSALVAADRIFHFYVALYWRWVSRVDPKSKWRFEPLPEPGSISAENVKDFPNVVVQLPMFNEKEVCQAVIDAACQLDWPKSRMMVQVLDDSTCAETRRRIEDKVFEHRERGVNVQHRTRTNRGGYKAGAMNDAIQSTDGTVCQYLGDAVMAFWGAPEAQADHALRACRGALEMRAAAEALEAQAVAKGHPAFTTRFGLNSGEVMVGISVNDTIYHL